jgi:hypothetical protein
MMDDSELQTIATQSEIPFRREMAAEILASRARIKRLEAALDRQGTFHGTAVAMVRDLRLALLRGDYLMKQEMDARSDAWLKDVDGPRPVRAAHGDGHVLSNPYGGEEGAYSANRESETRRLK